MEFESLIVHHFNPLYYILSSFKKSLGLILDLTFTYKNKNFILDFLILELQKFKLLLLLAYKIC